MRPLGSVLLLAVAIAGTGCSTLASYESIAFESDPSGADVVVQCGAKLHTTVTPGHVIVLRKAPDCLATISKEGYGDERIWLKSNGSESLWADTLALAVRGGAVLITSSAGGGVDGEVAGEFMVTGFIPWIVSLATCDICNHGPPEIQVVLRPRPARASN